MVAINFDILTSLRVLEFILKREGVKFIERYSNRKIDELGRLILPSSLRKDMDWDTGDSIALYALDKNTVILHMSEECRQENKNREK